MNINVPLEDLTEDEWQHGREELCWGSSGDGYVCSREKNHTGTHVAMIGGENRLHNSVAAWRQVSFDEVLAFFNEIKQETS